MARGRVGWQDRTGARPHFPCDAAAELFSDSFAALRITRRCSYGNPVCSLLTCKLLAIQSIEQGFISFASLIATATFFFFWIDWSVPKRSPSVDRLGLALRRVLCRISFVLFVTFECSGSTFVQATCRCTYVFCARPASEDSCHHANDHSSLRGWHDQEFAMHA